MTRAVIITGTKRGIGHELKLQFLRTHFVISINRTVDQSSVDLNFKSNNNEIIFNLNIEDPNTWVKIKEFCKLNSYEIDFIFFNAGINISDNEFNYTPMDVFTKNLNTNFNSVLTSINCLGINFSSKFIYISSMSVLFSSKNNISYALSKNCAETLFITLNSIYKNNKFQIIRLGPVKTDFTKDLLINSGILKKSLFKLIALDCSDCAIQISKYAKTNKSLINLPLSSYILYSFFKFLISPIRSLFNK
jgi:short-subunit dehydrogenase